MRLPSPQARPYLDAFLRVLPRSVIGLDFDGVLAPIVDDPAQAYIHPEGARLLEALAPKVRRIAVITGRPARQALVLGGLDEIGARIAADGGELEVFGQYGNEHWSSAQRRIVSPRPPHGLSRLIGDLPRLLRTVGAAEATIEEKGLAVAVHTRRLAEPQRAYDALLPVLREAADAAGLSVEPGKLVIEIRSGAMDKGRIVQRLAEAHDAAGFAYVGDDLGDIPAFRALARLRTSGTATLAVCSASQEQTELQALADLSVDGPDGVMELLDSWASTS